MSVIMYTMTRAIRYQNKRQRLRTLNKMRLCHTVCEDNCTKYGRTCVCRNATENEHMNYKRTN